MKIIKSTLLACFLITYVYEVKAQDHSAYLAAEKLYKDKKYNDCLMSIEAILNQKSSYPDSTVASSYKLRGDLFLKEFDLKNTLAMYQLSDDIYAKYGNHHFHQRLILANKSGICYAQQDNLIKTAEFFQKEYDIAIQNYKPTDLTVGKSTNNLACLLYTSPSPRDATLSRMPSSA